MTAATVAALTAVGSSFGTAEQRAPVAKTETLAMLDDAMTFLRAGIDALQNK